MGRGSRHQKSVKDIRNKNKTWGSRLSTKIKEREREGEKEKEEEEGRGKEKDKQASLKVIGGMEHSGTLQASQHMGGKDGRVLEPKSSKLSWQSNGPYLRENKYITGGDVLQQTFPQCYSQVANSNEMMFNTVCQWGNANQSHKTPLQTRQRLKQKLETD